MNRGQIRTFTGLWTSDPNDTRYNATVKNDVINIANLQFATDSEALEKESTFTIVADDATYDLPSDFMWAKEFDYEGNNLPVAKRYTLSRNAQSSDWRDDKGTPTAISIDPEEARKQLLLYPKPQNAGDTLTMIYYPKPDDMSSDSDDPLNGDTYLVRFHMGVAVYAAWMLLGYETLTPEIDAKMSKLWNLYQYYVNEAKDNAGNSAQEFLNMRGGRNHRP